MKSVFKGAIIGAIIGAMAWIILIPLAGDDSGTYFTMAGLLAMAPSCATTGAVIGAVIGAIVALVKSESAS